MLRDVEEVEEWSGVFIESYTEDGSYWKNGGERERRKKERKKVRESEWTVELKWK